MDNSGIVNGQSMDKWRFTLCIFVTWLQNIKHLTEQAIFNHSYVQLSNGNLGWIKLITQMNIKIVSIQPLGGSINGDTQKMGGLQWNLPVKWMIWGYPYCWKTTYHGLPPSWHADQAPAALTNVQRRHCHPPVPAAARAGRAGGREDVEMQLCA